MVNEFVAPEGKLDAPVVVLGEVPGKVEMVEGQPFVGPAGRLLFDSFFLSGLVVYASLYTL